MRRPVRPRPQARNLPYLYYYSAIHHAFIVERANGTDSHLLGEGVMPATDIRVRGDGWSASGNWFMWTSVDGTIEGNASYFMASLWVVSLDGQQRLTDFDGLPIIDAWWSPTSDLLAILVGSDTVQYTTDAQEVNLLFYDVANQTWFDSKTSFQLAQGLYYASWSPTGTDFLLVSNIGDESPLLLHVFNQQGEVWYSDFVDTIFSGRVHWLADGSLLQINLTGDLYLHRPTESTPIGSELESPVQSFSVSPDGQTLLMATTDQNLHRYTFADGLFEPKIASNVSPDSGFGWWSPDSQRVLIVDERGSPLYLLDLPSLILNEISVEMSVGVVRPSHNIEPIWSDERVIFNLHDGAFEYNWNAQTVEQIGQSNLNSMSASPDGRTRLSSDNYCAPSERIELGFEPICLEDMTTGTMSFVPPHSAALHRYGPVWGYWSDDGEWAILREHANIGSSYVPYYSVATRNGNQHRELAAGISARLIGWLPDYIDVRQIPSSQSTIPRLSILAHNNFATAVAWSPDGSTIASGGQDGAVQLWSATTGANITSLPLADNNDQPQYIVGLGWSLDGMQLGVLTRYFDDDYQEVFSVQVWDSANQSLLFRVEPTTEWNDIDATLYVSPYFDLFSETHGIVFGVDVVNQQAALFRFGRWGVSASEIGVVTIPEKTYVQVYSWETGDTSRVELIGTETRPMMGNVSLTDDGHYVAVVGGDSPNLYVWDLTTGGLVQEIAISGVALDFSPDGKRVAVATSYYIKVWDLPN